MTTAIETAPEQATYLCYVCWECDGPCRTYKGSVHGWRCAACIERYLAASAAKAEAEAEKSRQRFIKIPNTPVEGRRWDGGGCATGRTTVPASTVWQRR